MALARYFWETKLGEFKSDQKYISKSWKPQKIIKSSSANVHIVDENLLSAFCKLFHLRIRDPNDPRKALSSKGFTKNVTETFTWK